MLEYPNINELANPQLLSSLTAIAKQEDKQLKLVINEAFEDYIQKKLRQNKLGELLDESINQYDELYMALAK